MVWIQSALYSTPKFYFSRLITNVHSSNSIREEICILDRNLFNSKVLDFLNFALLYVLPLLVMTVSDIKLSFRKKTLCFTTVTVWCVEWETDGVFLFVLTILGFTKFLMTYLINVLTTKNGKLNVHGFYGNFVFM